MKQYGPGEWNLVSQRMNVALNQDAKSCLGRWKNYPRPGIKKDSPRRISSWRFDCNFVEKKGSKQRDARPDTMETHCHLTAIQQLALGK
ncbi:hypothetical protein BHM03_00045456 [Ensete ventricosum]|nr:hypothetical protein BHM03_00045456 [Ensete ventricosum]